eukprot:17699-Heterococcus_DN1.PRE.2
MSDTKQAENLALPVALQRTSDPYSVARLKLQTAENIVAVGIARVGFTYWCIALCSPVQATARQCIHTVHLSRQHHSASTSPDAITLRYRSRYKPPVPVRTPSPLILPHCTPDAATSLSWASTCCVHAEAHIQSCMEIVMLPAAATTAVQ